MTTQLGSYLADAGRPADAIALLEPLVAVEHPDPDAVNALGIAYARANHPERAAAAFKRALDDNPDNVQALENIGTLEMQRGDLPAAQRALEQAAAIDPRSARAHNGLGVIAMKTGRPEEAFTQWKRAVELSPNDFDALFNLSMELDAAGRHEEAFAAARSANAASRTATGAAYDRAEHERFAQRLIDSFAQPSSGAGPAPAIFVCGLFRSGSTLVEQILGAHSRVTAGGELDLVPALVARIDGYPEAVPAADARTLEDWRDFYRSGLPPHDATLLTDKRPDNFLHLGLIKTLFPDAKIVHTRRDPLDNLLSLYFLHLDPGMAYALDLADAAHWHGQHERLMAHWKSLYPNDIFDLDYDELVREPRPVIERLLAFLGLDWEDGLLDFHTGAAPVRTASVWQVRQPLHARSSGRWRNYREQLWPIAGLERR